MAEIKVVVLKCPSCGGALEISPGTDSFACGYCGASSQVVRSGGTISLAPLEESVAGIRRGTDKTAAELAIRRITEELREREAQRNQHLEDKRSAASWYQDKIQQTRNQGGIVPSLIVACIVAGLCLWVTPAKEIGAAIGLGAGLGVFVYVLNILQRGFDRQAAKHIAARDAAMAEWDQAIRAVDEQIVEKRTKLEAQRRIVEHS